MDDEESWLYGDPSETEDQSKSATNEDMEHNDQPDLDVMFFSCLLLSHWILITNLLEFPAAVFRDSSGLD